MRSIINSQSNVSNPTSKILTLGHVYITSCSIDELLQRGTSSSSDLVLIVYLRKTTRAHKRGFQMGIDFSFLSCLMIADLKALDDSGLGALFSKDRGFKTVTKVQVYKTSQPSTSEGKLHLLSIRAFTTLIRLVVLYPVFRLMRPYLRPTIIAPQLYHLVIPSP